MDVVYLLRRWPRNCIELKYSLRTLENLKHDNVYVIWFKPDRLTNVIHIPYFDSTKRFENVRNKYRIICENEEISDDFILMHDDNYILKPIKELKYYIRWTLQEHSDVIYERFNNNHYYHAIKEVQKIFPNWYSFDTHTPIIFNKDKLANIMEMYGDSLWSKRSIYCNYYNIKPDILSESYSDCKVIDGNYIEAMKKLKFFSTSDKMVIDSWFIQYIDKIFNKPSIYEKTQD